MDAGNLPEILPAGEFFSRVGDWCGGLLAGELRPGCKSRADSSLFTQCRLKLRREAVFSLRPAESSKFIQSPKSRWPISGETRVRDWRPTSRLLPVRRNNGPRGWNHATPLAATYLSAVLDDAGFAMLIAQPAARRAQRAAFAGNRISRRPRRWPSKRGGWCWCISGRRIAGRA